MRRSSFLLLAGCIGLTVGCFALALPAELLATKEVPPLPATCVWVREVGVLLIALSATALRVRNHEDSPTLRAILWGNALVQLGLLPIELLAWHQGTLPSFAGIAPNTALHGVLAVAFFRYATQRAPAA